METINRTVFNAFLRQDFYAFLERAFLELEPRRKFIHSWHLELIAAKLEACRRGECRRLIINMPPRGLKSLATSVVFPAWLLGHDPTTQIIAASYARDLSEKLARDCRTLMNSPLFKEIFRTRLSPSKHSVDEFETTQGGFRIATSVDGVMTGRGASFIIIDDPIKPKEAISDTLRKQVNDWYDHTLYSRLNHKATGCIVLVMQRLNVDDLVGHVLEQEPWEVVSLPAIAEQRETHEIWTPYKVRHHTREPGDVLNPNWESRESLEQTRRTLGEYHFSAQYQQSPVPMGGGMVKREWFRTYDEDDLPEKFQCILQSWDTASKESELANFSVCTTWGIQDGQIYLLHVERKRMGYPELKRTVRELGARFNADTILIEDKSSGTQLIQELRHENIYQVQPIKPEGDKAMRLNSQTATIEGGFVHLPKSAPWLSDYLIELTTFPKGGKYTDQVDSTSQALQWIKNGMWSNGRGLIEYMRQEIERFNKQSS